VCGQVQVAAVCRPRHSGATAQADSTFSPARGHRAQNPTCRAKTQPVSSTVDPQAQALLARGNLWGNGAEPPADRHARFLRERLAQP